MLPLITYTVVRILPPPPLLPDALASYELAGNGVFYHAAHPAIEARVLVAPITIRGLPDLEPFVHLRVPRIPGSLLLQMLDVARREHDTEGPLEVVLHLTWSAAQGWEVHLPAQRQTRLSVQPLESGPESTYERAIVEVHSHHAMPAFYSTTDAADDRWFRFNCVLGRIFDAPEILVRLGVDGYHATVPAGTLFCLPAGIRDVADCSPSADGAVAAEEPHDPTDSEEASA